MRDTSRVLNASMHRQLRCRVEPHAVHRPASAPVSLLSDRNRIACPNCIDATTVALQRWTTRPLHSACDSIATTRHETSVCISARRAEPHGWATSPHCQTLLRHRYRPTANASCALTASMHRQLRCNVEPTRRTTSRTKASLRLDNKPARHNRHCQRIACRVAGSQRQNANSRPKAAVWQWRDKPANVTYSALAAAWRAALACAAAARSSLMRAALPSRPRR